MTSTGSKRKLTEPTKAEQQVKDMQRMLAGAEQKIRKLQDKITDQQRQIRELRAQAKHEESLIVEQNELKAEIADLRSETKELTRANREHVARNDALQAEIARLKADRKVRKSNDLSAGANSGRILQLSPS